VLRDWVGPARTCPRLDRHGKQGPVNCQRVNSDWAWRAIAAREEQLPFGRFYRRANHPQLLEGSISRVPRGNFFATRFSKAGAISNAKGNPVERIQSFQDVAHDAGFVELNTSADETVLWLIKSGSHAAETNHQRMCIDTLTNSVTIFWMTPTGKLDSTTFRQISALQKWCGLEPAPMAKR
jgi:hypothetical protein